MGVSIEDVKRLKDLTGVGLTDAKKALDEANGDFDAALSQLAEGVKRALMNVVTINPKQRLAVVAANDLMGSPELVNDGLGLVHAWK